MKDTFWDYLERLVGGSTILIDRPRNTRHPNYPDLVYPLDYGYLENTSAVDNAGVDVWTGLSGSREISALVLTVDLHKRDAEIKILLGCSDQECQTIFAFHNRESMRAFLLRKPEDHI